MIFYVLADTIILPFARFRALITHNSGSSDEQLLVCLSQRGSVHLDDGVVFYDTLQLLRALLPISTRRELKKTSGMGISFKLGVSFEHWVEDKFPAFIGEPHKEDFDAFMTVCLYHEILLVLCDSFFYCDE